MDKFPYNMKKFLSLLANKNSFGSIIIKYFFENGASLRFTSLQKPLETWVSEWASEGGREGVSEWVEWVSEWVSDWVSEWVIYANKVDDSYFLTIKVWTSLNAIVCF